MLTTLALGGSIGYGHQHSRRTTDPYMVLAGRVDYGHQHGLRRLHRPPTSSWPFVAARDTNMTSSSSRLWISTWPFVVLCFIDLNMTPGCCRTWDIQMNLGLSTLHAQWTIDHKVAFRGSLDHRGLLRKSHPENELFFHLG